VNALDESLIEELGRVSEDLHKPGEARVVVLSSAHDSFMVGADLNMINRGWDRVRANVHAFQQVVNLWESIPCPTIALIGGHALGAGCELALACTWRIMSRGHGRIGLPEARRGLIAAGGGTQRMARIVGRAQALDLCLRGRMIDADEAYRIGLVSCTCDPADLDHHGSELAQEIVDLPPLTLAAVKRCVLEGLDVSLAEGLAIEEREMVAVGETFDSREGVQSFLEKRPPRFEGR
jgi:enoyl-CoA hydratase